MGQRAPIKPRQLSTLIHHHPPSSTMEELRCRYLIRPQYAASSYAPKAHVWKRKENGQILSIKTPNKQYAVAILTVIGKVSENALFVDGLGGWRSTFENTPIHKAKYQMQMERPEGTSFAPDWDVAVGTIQKFQNQVKGTLSARNLIIGDNADEPYLRFMQHAFEERTNTNNQQGFDTDMWTVPDEYELQFYEAGQRYAFTPIKAFDIDGERLGSADIADGLRGNVVEVHFSIRHYRLRDAKNELYDSFTGHIEDVWVLQHCAPMTKNVHVNWRELLATTVPVAAPTATPVRANPPALPQTPTPAATMQVDPAQSLTPVRGHRGGQPLMIRHAAQASALRSHLVPIRQISAVPETTNDTSGQSAVVDASSAHPGVDIAVGAEDMVDEPAPTRTAAATNVTALPAEAQVQDTSMLVDTTGEPAAETTTKTSAAPDIEPRVRFEMPTQASRVDLFPNPAVLMGHRFTPLAAEYNPSMLMGSDRHFSASTRASITAGQRVAGEFQDGSPRLSGEPSFAFDSSDMGPTSMEASSMNSVTANSMNESDGGSMMTFQQNSQDMSIEEDGVFVVSPSTSGITRGNLFRGPMLSTTMPVTSTPFNTPTRELGELPELTASDYEMVSVPVRKTSATRKSKEKEKDQTVIRRSSRNRSTGEV
uniref:Uncharacterized protein n=1 Tax=Mycena chlorophos TaxID=658473 RepID=A0ABQ0LJS2_MYCCL|nr:predicted protein [Mycena chlorophos]